MRCVFNNHCVFQYFNLWLLILSILTREGFSQNESDCLGINCESPPTNIKCKVISKDNISFPRPRGAKSECCFLWRCSEEDDPDKFFTFHGVSGFDYGGTETVAYDNKSHIVTSVATGKHDAVANAGGSEADIQEALDSILSQVDLG